MSVYPKINEEYSVFFLGSMTSLSLDFSAILYYQTYTPSCGLGLKPNQRVLASPVILVSLLHKLAYLTWQKDLIVCSIHTC